MTTLALVLFYGYVVTLVVAGGFGMVAAPADVRLLSRLDPNRLGSTISTASLLSQYRFLRAVEMGFGISALAFRREIFTEMPLARFFFGTMLAGIVARIVGWVVDGRPYGAHIGFMLYEVVSIVVIVLVIRPPLGF